MVALYDLRRLRVVDLMICDVCAGRGWLVAQPIRGPLLSSISFPDRCFACAGSGKLSWGRIAALLDEDDGTVRRVNRGKARVKTAKRVFEKVCEVLGWKRQTEMFG
jgi:hypothetical protein